MAKLTRRTDFGPCRIETVDLYGVTVATANVDGHTFDPGDARSEVGCSRSKDVLSSAPIIRRKDGVSTTWFAAMC